MSLPSGLCSHPVAVRDYLSEYGCATHKWAKTDKPVELVINSSLMSNLRALLSLKPLDGSWLSLVTVQFPSANGCN